MADFESAYSAAEGGEGHLFVGARFDAEDDVWVSVVGVGDRDVGLHLRRPEVRALRDHLDRLLGETDQSPEEGSDVAQENPEPRRFTSKREVRRELNDLVDLIGEKFALWSTLRGMCCDADSRYDCDSMDAFMGEIEDIGCQLRRAYKKIKRRRGWR